MRTLLSILLILAIGQAAQSAEVRPGDDFYRYANNDWLGTAALPPGVEKFDTRDMLRTLNQRRVRDLLHDLADPQANRSHLEQIVGDYYASLADDRALEANDALALQNDLDEIWALADISALSAYLGGITRKGDAGGAATDGLFAVWVHQGFTDPDRPWVHFQQGGLGLADRDDYLDQAPEKVALRSKYRATLTEIFRSLSLSHPDQRAAQVMALETAIARSHASEADTADTAKANNPWSRADFDRKAPGMDWSAFFQAAGLAGQDNFLVWQPSAAQGAGSLAAQEPLDHWKNYLAARLFFHEAPYLAQASRTLASLGGSPSDAESRAIAGTDAVLGEGIGKLYVARFTSPDAKAAAQDMVRTIRAATRRHLEALSWMTPATKTKALAKLETLDLGLVYPDRWTDFDSLRIVRGDPLGNFRRAEAFAYRRQLAELALPVDPGKWEITPQSGLAILNFSPNSMQFSAGILQPPFFDVRGDAASNYGSAGAGLAHEVLHSFDLLGNLYDAQGRVVESWWTAEDEKAYRAAAQPLIRQMESYCPLPETCVKGEQTLGETANDLGGLAIAHDAYLASLKGKPDRVIRGLTGEQRFFLAFAQRWRRIQTEAALKKQLETDTHAPGEYRADLVRNLDAWNIAFGVKPGDKLFLEPAARVKIW